MDSITTTVALSMAEADAAVRAALSTQGFGVLTEIDVAATLKAKLDIDRPPLRILGACNPSLAHQALELDPTVSLLLPCNVVLEAVDAGVRVSAIDPSQLMPGEEFAALADQARAKLSAALHALPAGAPAS